MKNPFSFEQFLKILEQDDCYAVDETSFYFEDDPDERDHMLGCIRDFEKPYWIGYCDVQGGCEFESAEELLSAEVFNGKSIKERWDHVVFCNVGGISIDDWLHSYPKLPVETKIEREMR